MLSQKRVSLFVTHGFGCKGIKRIFRNTVWRRVCVVCREILLLHCYLVHLRSLLLCCNPWEQGLSLGPDCLRKRTGVQSGFDYILSHLWASWDLCIINYPEHGFISFSPTIGTNFSLLMNSSYGIKKFVSIWSSISFSFLLCPLSFTTNSLREASLLPSFTNEVLTHCLKLFWSDFSPHYSPKTASLSSHPELDNCPFWLPYLMLDPSQFCGTIQHWSPPVSSWKAPSDFQNSAVPHSVPAFLVFLWLPWEFFLLLSPLNVGDLSLSSLLHFFFPRHSLLGWILPWWLGLSVWL